MGFFLFDLGCARTFVPISYLSLLKKNPSQSWNNECLLRVFLLSLKLEKAPLLSHSRTLRKSEDKWGRAKGGFCAHKFAQDVVTCPIIAARSEPEVGEQRASLIGAIRARLWAWGTHLEPFVLSKRSMPSFSASYLLSQYMNSDKKSCVIWRRGRREMSYKRLEDCFRLRQSVV